MFSISGKSVALITGSGFSKEAGLPLTNELLKNFANLKCQESEARNLSSKTDEILLKFWKDIFCYCGRKNVFPTFEDHFTILDKAANTGHNLGPFYSPKRLRAIRRMSIHRIFEILDRPCDSESIKKLFRMLHKNNLSFVIITLNWDIVAERMLEREKISFSYPGAIEEFEEEKSSSINSTNDNKSHLPIYKMHGSSNWAYCDICRRWWHFPLKHGKGVLNKNVLLKKADFEMFGKEIDEGDFLNRPNCPKCRGDDEKHGNVSGDKEQDKFRLSTRVGTFSFRKDLVRFQEIWEKAHTELQEADKWLFVGYSLPEADYEFKHLLKSAQMSHKNPENLRIEVVLKEDIEASDRYKALFGTKLGEICQGGLDSWVRHRLDQFKPEIKNNG